MDRSGATEKAQNLQAALGQLVFGQSDTIEGLVVALVAGGHALLEGVPGLAKTMLVRSLGSLIRCRFSRIQFTPDLMPGDITGVSMLDLRTNVFQLRRGPLFADLVLADEINRTPPKTQAALLEAMQEKQISLDGETHPLAEIFTVVATQNSVDHEGTYPLPEAQLDRFLLKVVLDYPGEDDELRMLQAFQQNAENDPIPCVATVDEVLEMRRAASQTPVEESVMKYCLALVRSSRQQRGVAVGASPRAAVMLLQAARALALVRGRDFVTPDEVQSMAVPVLRHRLLIRPEMEIEGLRPEECVRRLIASVVVPR